MISIDFLISLATVLALFAVTVASAAVTWRALNPLAPAPSAAPPAAPPAAFAVRRPVWTHMRGFETGIQCQAEHGGVGCACGAWRLAAPDVLADVLGGTWAVACDTHADQVRALGYSVYPTDRGQ